jgi:hypothetical protein
LQDNVAQSDTALFNWIEAWFADIFQKPAKKCGTAVAIRGKQGAGKSIVGKTIGSLLGPHFKSIASPRLLTGQFNAHMTALLLLHADEAFWAGDHKAEGILKDLVTGEKNPIEHKGKEIFWVDNHIRLFITGNPDWVVPAGFEERRFATLDVGELHREDHPYFAAIEHQMCNGGREALLYHLLHNVDCSAVDLRTIPRTAALFEQKVQSMNSEQGWWLDVLRRGILPGDWEGTGQAPKEFVYRNYTRHGQHRGVLHRALETKLGMFLHKVVPGLTTSRATYRVHPSPYSTEFRQGGTYLFPSLAECRAAFEKQLNQELVWDTEGTWMPAKTEEADPEEKDEA